jgi:Flp pilus assembly protein TadG
MSHSARPTQKGAVTKGAAKKGTEGAVLVEFMAVFFPLLSFFLGILQLLFIHTANFVTQHSAAVAARAAAVVFADNPKGSKKDVERAARIPLATLGLDAGDVKVNVSPGNPTRNAMIVVTVTVDYPCFVPLGSWIACGGPKKTLIQGAAMPNQGASYKY